MLTIDLEVTLLFPPIPDITPLADIFFNPRLWTVASVMNEACEPWSIKALITIFSPCLDSALISAVANNTCLSFSLSVEKHETTGVLSIDVDPAPGGNGLTLVT